MTPLIVIKEAKPACTGACATCRAKTAPRGPAREIAAEDEGSSPESQPHSYSGKQFPS